MSARALRSLWLRTVMMINDLGAVVVRYANRSCVGFLYLETGTIVVLLNDVPKGVALGSVQSMVSTWLEPEATITIIPREQIQEIEALVQ